jgi:hypothetical protein
MGPTPGLDRLQLRSTNGLATSGDADSLSTGVIEVTSRDSRHPHSSFPYRIFDCRFLRALVLTYVFSRAHSLHSLNNAHVFRNSRID